MKAADYYNLDEVDQVNIVEDLELKLKTREVMKTMTKSSASSKYKEYHMVKQC